MSGEDSVELSFGQRVGLTLQTLRRFRGVKQEEVSKTAGITRAMLSQYERGSTVPSLESLDKVLEALGADLATFHQYRQVVSLLQEEPQRGAQEPGMSSETALRQMVDSFHILLRTLRAEALYGYLHHGSSKEDASRGR